MIGLRGETQFTVDSWQLTVKRCGEAEILRFARRGGLTQGEHPCRMLRFRNGTIGHTSRGGYTPLFSYQGETKDLQAESVYQGETKELRDFWVRMREWGDPKWHKNAVPQA